MGLFNKLALIAQARKTLNEMGIDPFNVEIEEILSPTEARIAGRRVLLAGTNNYLGLTFDPQCIEAACQATRSEGTGTTGSRMANGTFSGHRALERELAEFFGCAKAIVFSTGFVANLGVISTLTGPGDTVIIDGDSHASIYDGCRMGGADILRFRHNDAADLEKRLRRLGDRAKNALVIVEGIYSMLGDRAPLAEIVSLKKQYGFWLMVDEAHSLGVLGKKGRGLVEEDGCMGDVDFIVGTFSKSLGAIGGFCVSNHPELDLVRYASRSYLFTASPSPATIASVRQALQALAAGADLRERLWANARKLYEGLSELGYRLGPEPTPVVAVYMGSKEETLACWKELLDNGIYVNLVLPPAAPEGKSLLRCSVSAAHTEEQVKRIVYMFKDLAAKVSLQHAPA
ncbi:serine palmitoyltransferase [Geobacter benzoatilyticus]|uniref:Aminotransferase class I/II-fold pyridoxal phosphate-dependent enzyme n=1 Tax=Geobacter benzoatilyticus TaxID=2815309 RepID=A0ABX7Q6J4_9BACT|nr:aminotransferase class I/II-fold pyridoxal phosphate-dependent enzyme [Geobacter benzoatilyticus]QSV46802.1 aminotransferase class I/II-fold pyridoxal phosphate-dependent enzyme [Geobacter benzoatilyticus]